MTAHGTKRRLGNARLELRQNVEPIRVERLLFLVPARLEFEAFLSYWLSGLFVVVEGFNKLKLKDSRTQKLFKEQVGYLKQLRHSTYHFTVNKASLLDDLILQTD